MSANPFGRAAEDGTVFVTTPEGEVAVGQYTIGSPEEGLAFFVGKFDALVAEAELTLQRLAAGRGTVESARELATRLQAQSAAPTVVGDLARLAGLATELVAVADEKAAERQAAKAAARAAAIARRTELALEAEGLAKSTAWKATQARFEAILEEWKTLPRADREAEQELWKRFSGARQVFDRARREHFAQLSRQSSAAKAAKTALLAEAEALSTSTEWGPTTIAFRELLDRWKAAPRGTKREEDALWEKFRAYQQAFFDAKRVANDERDESFKANLEVKLLLLAEAEALLPIGNIAAAKSAFRKLADKWEKAGHVPRADLPKVDARWKAVQHAIAEAEAEEWRKNDPSRKAFAASTASKFQESVQRIEQELETAKSNGSPKVAELEAQLANAKALLEAAIRHA